MTSGEKIDPAAAWAASCAAVALIMGAAPAPAPLKTVRRRDTRAATWRRSLALYTAAVSLNVGSWRLMPHAPMDRRAMRVALQRMEDRRDQPAIDQLLDLLKDEAERQLAVLS